jgi:hypothetical protein
MKKNKFQNRSPKISHVCEPFKQLLFKITLTFWSDAAACRESGAAGTFHPPLLLLPRGRRRQAVLLRGKDHAHAQNDAAQQAGES